jgi:hypothetical protein
MHKIILGILFLIAIIGHIQASESPKIPLNKLLVTLNCNNRPNKQFKAYSTRPVKKAKEIAAEKNWPEIYHCSEVALYEPSVHEDIHHRTSFEWQLREYFSSTLAFLILALNKKKLPPASRLNIAFGCLKNPNSLDNDLEKAEKEAYKHIRAAFRSDMPLDMNGCRIKDLDRELTERYTNQRISEKRRKRAYLYWGILTAHTQDNPDILTLAYQAIQKATAKSTINVDRPVIEKIQKLLKNSVL